MSFYQEMATTASKLLYDFGQPVTIKRQNGVIDPVTGAGGEWQTLNTVGVASRYAERAINGTSVLAGDQKLTLLPTVAPLIGDIVTVSGVDYRVVDIAQSAPAGMVLVYFAQVRL